MHHATRIALISCVVFAFSCGDLTTRTHDQPVLEIAFDGSGSGGAITGHLTYLRVYADGTGECDCNAAYPVPGSRRTSSRHQLEQANLDEIEALTASREFQSALDSYPRANTPIDYSMTFSIRSTSHNGTKQISVDDYFYRERFVRTYFQTRTHVLPHPIARLLDLAYELNLHLCAQLPEPQ